MAVSNSKGRSTNPLDAEPEEQRVTANAKGADGSRLAEGGTFSPAGGVAEDDWMSVVWDNTWSFIIVLRRYFRLCGAMLAAGILLAVASHLLTSPRYTATAVVGPPGPSPTGSLMGNMGRGVSSGLIGGMFGGGSSSGRDPFQDFQQLLPSSRLSQALIERDHILPIIFKGQWDAEAKRWRPPGPLRSAVWAVKRLLHIPYSKEPGIDNVTQFLAGGLSVANSKRSPSGGLLGRTNSYMEVSFTYSSPEEAEWLLDLILAETDQIVREDQRRDVSARISFLKEELARQDLAADERSALISILSGQEQLRAMIQADQRYASDLIVPPHAPLTPTSPPGIVTTVLRTAFVAIVLWLVVVFLSMRVHRVRQMIEWSRRKETDSAEGNSRQG